MYALMGQVIERVTNLSWGEVLAQKVLEALDLAYHSYRFEDPFRLAGATIRCP